VEAAVRGCDDTAGSRPPSGLPPRSCQSRNGHRPRPAPTGNTWQRLYMPGRTRQGPAPPGTARHRGTPPGTAGHRLAPTGTDSARPRPQCLSLRNTSV